MQMRIPLSAAAGTPQHITMDPALQVPNGTTDRNHPRPAPKVVRRRATDEPADHLALAPLCD
jgi:hypothetical protein